MDIDLKKLQEKFKPCDIEWRIQTSGISNGKAWALTVPYLTNRAIMQRLDDVCGAENWKNEYLETTCEKYVTDYKTKEKKLEKVYGFICGISIKINGEWVTKYDGAENTDIETLKGGLSDSMKRSAVQWGMGRHLYSMPKTYAECTTEKREGFEYAKTKDGVIYWRPPTGQKEEAPPPKPKDENRDRLLNDIGNILKTTVSGKAVFTDYEIKAVKMNCGLDADLESVLANVKTELEIKLTGATQENLF